MDRLEAMRVFIAVAEERGFAAGARRLGMSAPAVTRAVAALEERIGARLLQRTTRVVRLTEAGTRFATDARRILDEVERAEALAAGWHDVPRGLLTVTAPITFGRMFVAPVLLEFLKQYPQVSARALFVDRVVDLMDEGVDVAIRIAHLPASSLSAVRVGHVRRVLCASPKYLAKRGTPKSPSDLSQHDVIALSTNLSDVEWHFVSGKRSETVLPPARLVANTADVAIGAALDGRGITRVLSYMIEPEVRAGRLRLLLESYEPPPVPVHIVFAEGRQASAKVRRFVDLATERLRAREKITQGSARKVASMTDAASTSR